MQNMAAFFIGKTLPPPNLPLGRGRDFTPYLMQSEILFPPLPRGGLGWGKAF